MTKSVSKLLKLSSSEEVVQYLSNVETLESIKRCVDEANYNSSIYKTVASFEDNDIVTATEVPLGDVKTKLNYLLKEAVSKSTAIISANLNIAGDIAKTWSDNTLIGNQQERLNATLSKLKHPVKSNPIPAYSSMTDSQRSRTAGIFQKAFNSSEPMSIDFVSEAIDRYNAGADYFVMFKALDISVDYGNAVGVYDNEMYAKLMDETVFHYLAQRFISYAELCQRISPVEGSSVTKHSLSDIRDLLMTVQGSHNKNVYNRIKGFGVGVTFTKPADEYAANYKTTTTHANIKQYVSGKNIVTPLTKTETDRLDAACKAVSGMSGVTLPNIDVAASSVTTDELYEILSLYFSFIEELTQSLYTFMFVTQVATRNNELVEGVITACDKVIEKIKYLFDSVNNNLPDDSSVSQEAVTTNINYIKSQDLSVPAVKDEELLLVYSNLKNSFKQSVDVTTRLKLRGYTSISMKETDVFKSKHAKAFTTLMGVDISEYTGEQIFNLVTSDFFNSHNPFLSNSVLHLDLFESTYDLSQAMIEVLSKPQTIVDLFKTPFGSVSTKTYECAIDDLATHLVGLKEAIDADDIELVKTRLSVFDYFLDKGSYFYNVAKLVDHAHFNTLRTVPRVPCLYEDDVVYTVGYQGLDRDSQDMLVELFARTREPSVRLRDLNTDAVDVVTGAYSTLYQTISSEALSKKILKNLEMCLKTLKDIGKGLEKIDYDYTGYVNVLDAIEQDIVSATSDVKLRASLIHLLYHTSYSTVNCLSDFYRTSNQLLTDFAATYV